MARICKLSMRGIRNFDDEREAPIIHFSRPLTLILGQNGTGKTTIIEALKYALSGEFPPGSEKGKTFVHDPSLKKLAAISVRGNVRVEISDVRGDKLTISRTVEAQRINQNVRFKTLDNAITRIDKKTGQKTMLSGRCGSADIEVMASMGVTKAILNYVLLCHQDDADWPFETGQKLKIRFDEIFDTSRYNKAIDSMRKMIKDKTTHQKVLVAEQETTKLFVDETNAKKNKLNNMETRRDEVKKKICKFDNKLEPIHKRLQEIREIEMEYCKWQIDEEKKKVEHKLLLQQIVHLKENIMDLYNDSTQELTKEIEAFEDMLAGKNGKITKIERVVNEKTSLELKMSKMITDKKVTIGTLKQQMKDQTNRISNRNKLLENIIESWELDEKIPIDFSEQDAKILINKIENNLSLFEKDIEKKRLTQDKEIEKLQHKLNALRSERVTLETQLTNNKRELINVQTEISTNKNVLKQSGAMDKKLSEIDEKLKVANEKLAQYEKSSEIDDLKSNLQEAVEREETNEQKANLLEKEIQSLRKHSELQMKLERARNELSEKESAIEYFKKKHIPTLEDCLGITDFPEGQMKNTIEEVQTVLDQRIKNLKKQMDTVQYEAMKLETSVKHKKAEFEKKTQENENDKAKISKLCGDYTNYRQVLSTLSQKVKDMEDKRGMYAYQGAAYKEYIEKLNKPNSCCPLCSRGFQDASEAKKLAADLKNDMTGHPERLKNYEKELAHQRQKYDALQQLQPIVKNIEKFENVESKNLSQEIEADSKRLADAKKKIKQLQDSIIEPERKLSFCKEMVSDVVLWDCFSTEAQGILLTVNDIEESLHETGITSKKTISQAEEEQRKVQQLLKETRREIKSLQSTLDLKNEELRQTSEKRTKLLEEQLEVHKGMREIKRAKEALETLSIKKTEVEAAIEDLEEKLTNVSSQLEIANKNLQQVMAKFRAAQETDRSKLRNRSKELDKLTTTQAEVVKFESRKIEDELSAMEKKLEKMEDEANIVKTESNNLRAELAKMKEELSSNEVKKRDLMDNLTLRKKEKNAEHLKKECEALKDKLQNTGFTNVSKERTNLCEKRDIIERERNTLKGQMEELELNITQMTSELNKPEYRDSYLNHQEKSVELVVTRLAIKDMQTYCNALDDAMIQYHEQRMITVNKCMKKLWNIIYMGTDTTSIQIKAEPTKVTGDRRQFSYKFVQIKHGVEMDMKGRCSAGQKVLASIVLRMALAEAFCNKCCVLALDEPTTNLDEENARSLAEALHSYVIRRAKFQKNFQLIIITHDDNFISKLGPLSRDNSFYQLFRFDSGLSSIKRVSFANTSLSTINERGDSSDEENAQNESSKKRRQSNDGDETSRPKKKQHVFV